MSHVIVWRGGLNDPSLFLQHWEFFCTYQMCKQRWPIVITLHKQSCVLTLQLLFKALKVTFWTVSWPYFNSSCPRSHIWGCVMKHRILSHLGCGSPLRRHDLVGREANLGNCWCLSNFRAKGEKYKGQCNFFQKLKGLLRPNKKKYFFSIVICTSWIFFWVPSSTEPIGPLLLDILPEASRLDLGDCHFWGDRMPNG